MVDTMVDSFIARDFPSIFAFKTLSDSVYPKSYLLNSV
jgi:hypothetical protein